MRFKIVYTIFLDDQEIGYIKNKKDFEKIVEEHLYNNEEENIAFSEINGQVKYIGKLIKRDELTTEEQALQAIKEKSDITYVKYAVNAHGKERECLKTMEQAEEICSNLIQGLGQNVDISVSKVYTRNYNIEEKIDMTAITNKIIGEIKEEQKRELSTINGVYIAVAPIQGHITSRYGSREAIRDHTHQGLDIAALTGTPIKAVADGTISYSGVRGGYGNMVIIEHGNGIKTYYGHCNELYVKVGKKVTAGEVIATVGNTGNSTGPHLHFEIRQDDVYVDPQVYLYN